MEKPHGKFQALTAKNLDTITDYGNVSGDDLFAMRVVSTVLPFRTNRYVIEHLIDWDRIPDDPVYQLVFPQRGMLADEDFRQIADLMVREAPKGEIERAVADIRAGLNPHPAGQREFNIPSEEDEVFEGLQHKYRETVLFFPSQGQTCHAYCTFCFRWAQFVGDKELKISSKDAEGLHRYLAAHPDVSDLLVTGGDPMIMKTRVMEGYLRPFIDDPDLAHVRNIRIGTKALTFWPHRFVHDEDADDMLRLLEDVVRSGRHVAIMAHFNHWQELQTGVVREAIRRLRDTGAVIRSQAPLLDHINNDPDVWARMWREQVRLGIVPYYMFVERDTGAKRYFEVPLVRCWEVFRQAVQQVSGLSRTVRGPSMSATPGKVEVLGVQEVGGEKVFVLRFLQGRDPDWVGRPFFAKFDPQATWLDGLKPAFGEDSFFFEDGLRAMTA
ncbi:MAG: lysine 2,3-aminomutase [Rhodospirillaceae bacterium]|nr:lysine 2,3-aminomutase [Rhodospirillaceae bacterium]MYB13339.1 lysine 2,3-aminomutase [Rhodospirillaceae bacterium]MYI50819.1 lysine 2,3-aminomutase [Rhodospirillaceae bacterium]